MNKFDMADVRVDVFSYGLYGGDHYNEGYRMTHKPTGTVVLGIGAPRLTSKQKMTMMEELKAQVSKNDAYLRSEEKP